MKTKLFSCCCGVAMLASGPVVASELRWQVTGDVGAIHESNPTKVENDEKADTRGIVQLGGRLFQDTESLFMDLEYKARHENWADDTFDDRNTLQGHGQITWRPADYFTFYANNRRQDLIVNNTFSDTQDNRSVRSTTELGARFTAHLGALDTLNVAPVYRQVNFSSGDGVDSNRPGVLAFWGHRLSKTDSFRVNVFAERIDFDSDSTQNDIDRAQAFVRYSARLNRLSYDIEAGMTWVVGDDSNNAEGVDDGDNDFSGMLFRAFVDYEHKNHLFQLRAFHDLTDTSIGLSDSTLGGVEYNPGDSNVNQLALVTRSQVDISYDLGFADERWNWGIGYRYDRQDVEATATEISLARDETRNWVYTSLQYNMTRNIDLMARGSYETIDFTDSPTEREDEYYKLGAAVNFNMFKYGRLSVGVEHEQRESNALAVIQDYTDLMVYANFRLAFPAMPQRRGVRSVGGYSF